MGWGKKLFGGAALAGIGLGASKVWSDATPPPVPRFYDPPRSLPPGKPGDLIRWEPVPTMTRSQIWRVLYRSTDADEKPIAVSGLIAAPPGPPPEGGWPLIGIAHGTTGLARGAAPSLTIDSEADSPGHYYETNIKPFLDAGYALALTDYQGLGAPGKPSYLIGVLEGRNVLDAIRAARNFSEITLSDQLLMWGHSQGGQSAAFAAEIAPEYAPELQFDGVVLVAPAGDLDGIFEGIIERNERSVLTVLPLTVAGSWSRSYPEAVIDHGMTRLGKFFVNQVVWRLRLEYAGLLSRLFRPSQLIELDAADRWRPYVEANTPGSKPIAPPLLVAQGSADQVIGKEYTDRFVERLREHGATVDYRVYPDHDHLTVLEPSTPEAITWMNERRTAANVSGNERY